MNKANQLSLVLNPVSETEFYEHYWEKNPLHISRSSTDHFSQLLSLDAIELMLSSQALHFPSVQLTHLNNKIDVSDYTDEARRIVPSRLIERHHEGATIVISQAHEKIASLADFRRDVQSAFKLRCQTNVYLSPVGQQGFNAHFDSHDVFILQIKGTKTFNFYEGGIELPYSHDSFDADEHPVGALTQCIKLEPGDTLYIPRGVLHDAVATDETSLHITLGVYAVTLRDVLMEMTQQLTSNDPSFRKSAPRDLDTLLINTDIQQNSDLQLCLSPTLSSTDLKNALANIFDAIALESAPNCQGRLTTPLIEPPHNNSWQLDLSLLISVERLNECIRIRTHGQILEFPDPFRATVELLLKAETVDIDDLTNLDTEQKRTLYTRLNSANLLITNK